MGEILKNAKAEFGKKAGKALGNALFGEYGEDKRVGVRFVDGSGKGSRSRKSRKTRSEDTDLARIKAEQKLLETKLNAENERLEDERYERSQAAAAAALSKKAAKLSSIEFDPDDPKQIVSQMNKIAIIAEMALKNNDDDDDGIAAAAISLYSTGLSMLKDVRPKSAMIPRFEQQLKSWSKFDRNKGWAKVWDAILLILGLCFSAAIWYGAFVLIKSCTR